jgi:predicted aspartyl protease
MTARLAYDANLDPPAPIVPVRILSPVGEDAIVMPMLIDTGADCTLVPAIIRRLGLPQVDVIGLSGVGGARSRATVHAASIEVGGLHLFVRVVAFADEAILGRDVLNQAIVTLDGPGLLFSVAGPSRKRRSRKRVPPA